jgi:hypothetical protein
VPPKLSASPPDSAYNIKSKPRVRDYMLEHRAAQQQRVEQDTDLSRRAVEGQPQLNVSRDQVLTRLWEIANLGPEMTRGSITLGSPPPLPASRTLRRHPPWRLVSPWPTMLLPTPDSPSQ